MALQWRWFAGQAGKAYAFSAFVCYSHCCTAPHTMQAPNQQQQRIDVSKKGRQWLWHDSIRLPLCVKSMGSHRQAVKQALAIEIACAPFALPCHSHSTEPVRQAAVSMAFCPDYRCHRQPCCFFPLKMNIRIASQPYATHAMRSSHTYTSTPPHRKAMAAIGTSRQTT